MTTRPCPEALYGAHGEPNTSGRCPYCRDQLVPRNWSAPRATGRASNSRTGSITHVEELRLDELRLPRDPWGETYIPLAQDPSLIDFDDGSYYD